MFAVVAMENSNNNAITSSSHQSDYKAMDNAALINENAELKRKITTLESDVSSLTEQHQSLQNLIVSKTKQIKEYRDQTSKWENACKEAQGKLQLNVQQTGAALLLLEEEASACREEKEHAEASLGAITTENDLLKKENETLREQLKAARVAVSAPPVETSMQLPSKTVQDNGMDSVSCCVYIFLNVITFIYRTDDRRNYIF